MSIRDDDCRYTVSVNRHGQVAISLGATSRNNFRIPGDLVLLMVRVVHKVVQTDLCKLFAFRNDLTRDLRNHWRVIHGFNRKVHRFRSRSALGVRCRKGQVFRTIPKRIRSRNFNGMVGRNRHLQILVAAHLPADLRGLV